MELRRRKLRRILIYAAQTGNDVISLMSFSEQMKNGGGSKLPTQYQTLSTRSTPFILCINQYNFPKYRKLQSKHRLYILLV